MSDWYKQDTASVSRELVSDPSRGLSPDEATRRLEQYGPNELIETGGRSPWMIIWDQVRGPMILLLVAAAVIALMLGEIPDGIAIAAIIVLNAILGFVQEYRAEKAMAALKQMAVPTVRVLRDGEVREISARDLVPGDIVLLETGNIVPADGRLVESHNLRIQEAALTGESEAVEKHTEALPEEHLGVGDRLNMVHMGTVVTYGRGRVLVTATGMQTELGHIARMLQSVDVEQTPLQRRLARLGTWLAISAVAIVALVFVLGLIEGRSLRLMLMTSIGMAVALVPEGLPAVATVCLAIGARRMLRRNALIRKLPAVETLGSVTVICSDKTGTLTENRMTVTLLDMAGDTLDLTTRLRGRSSVLEPGDGIPENIADRPAFALMLAGGALCNDAALQVDPESGARSALGDPTEGALVVAAARFGLRKDELDAAFPRQAEVPFDSERKRMTTVHRGPAADSTNGTVGQVARALPMGPNGAIAFTKGAVDGLLEVSDRVWTENGIEPLDDGWRERIRRSNDELASRGMRVLGVALRPLEAAEGDGAEQQLVFIGMFGMIDPPRPEVREAVARCRTAGIRPIMITGDHPLTARQIARELGITGDGDVRTGRDLVEIETAELERTVEEVSVYARVSPEHKLRIVEALQNRGHVVAMTGDGVNDAPALRKADIGVAMGITGTDVSKEASNMVLLDDNFATIVNAVEQGRIVYDNIRKFVRYALTSNTGELLVMLLPSILGLAFEQFREMPLPLLPLQLLWLNLVTDGLPGLALTVEPAEPRTMRRPPIRPDQGIVDRAMIFDILWIGPLMGLIAFGVGWWFWDPAQTADDAGERAYRWRTMILAILTFAQMGNALASRSTRDSVFTIGLLTNKALLGAILLTIATLFAVLYIAPLQRVFYTVPLSATDLLICVVASAVVFCGAETYKWFMRRREKGAAPPAQYGTPELRPTDERSE